MFYLRVSLLCRLYVSTVELVLICCLRDVYVIYWFVFVFGVVWLLFSANCVFCFGFYDWAIWVYCIVATVALGLVFDIAACCFGVFACYVGGGLILFGFCFVCCGYCVVVCLF